VANEEQGIANDCLDNIQSQGEKQTQQHTLIHGWTLRKLTAVKHQKLEKYEKNDFSSQLTTSIDCFVASRAAAFCLIQDDFRKYPSTDSSDDCSRAAPF
jgi:hypothetical protein